MYHQVSLGVGLLALKNTKMVGCTASWLHRLPFGLARAKSLRQKKHAGSLGWWACSQNHPEIREASHSPPRGLTLFQATKFYVAEIVLAGGKAVPTLMPASSTWHAISSLCDVSCALVVFFGESLSILVESPTNMTRILTTHVWLLSYLQILYKFYHFYNYYFTILYSMFPT